MVSKRGFLVSTLVNKLIKVQSTLNAPKLQRNNFGKYNYRSCEDIMCALKPLLAAEGLLQLIDDEIVQVGDRFYIKATVTVTDGTNTIAKSAFAREPLTKKGMDDAQITGTTSSYARKYALNGMYNIDDNKDADTNEYRNQAALKAKEEVKKVVIDFCPDEVLRQGTEAMIEGDFESVQNEFGKYWKSLKNFETQQQKLKEVYELRKEELTPQA
jgi:hypothetical protein